VGVSTGPVRAAPTLDPSPQDGGRETTANTGTQSGKNARPANLQAALQKHLANGAGGVLVAGQRPTVGQQAA